jgi:hypothetical protein
VREIGIGGREREREGRVERDFFIVVGREGKVSVVAEGSVRDWVVRCESKPIIGVAVVIVVVVIRETSVRRIKAVVVTEDDMVVIGVIVFTGLVLEAFGGFGFGGVK